MIRSLARWWSSPPHHLHAPPPGLPVVAVLSGDATRFDVEEVEAYLTALRNSAQRVGRVRVAVAAILVILVMTPIGLVVNAVGERV